MKERGSVNLFLGTMFSGKNKRAMKAMSPLITGDCAQDYILFQSSWNKRDGNVWKSRGLDYTLPAHVIDVSNPNFLVEMAEMAKDKPIIGIDEPFSFVSGDPKDFEENAKKYSERLCALVLGWREAGKQIYIPSIHAFFNRRPVQFVSRLYGDADRVEFCTEATCNICKKPASLTQRTFNGMPSKYDEPLLVLDGSPSWNYFPVCADHFLE